MGLSEEYFLSLTPALLDRLCARKSALEEAAWQRRAHLTACLMNVWLGREQAVCAGDLIPLQKEKEQKGPDSIMQALLGATLAAGGKVV